MITCAFWMLTLLTANIAIPFSNEDIPLRRISTTYPSPPPPQPQDLTFLSHDLKHLSFVVITQSFITKELKVTVAKLRLYLRSHAVTLPYLLATGTGNLNLSY